MKPIKLLLPLLFVTLTFSQINMATSIPRGLDSRSPSDGRWRLRDSPLLQVTENTLTNDDVLKMIAAGLSETTIIQVIQKVPNVFDTSPDALIKLKQGGASTGIIEAMLGTTRPTASAIVPAEQAGKGVFVQRGTDWNRIEEVSSIEVRNVGQIANTVTFGVKEARVISVFRGEKAEQQLNQRRPVFRVAGLGASARDVYIVALRLNPDRRDLEMGRQGLIKKMSFGFRKRDVRDVEVKRLGEDLFEVTPKQDLEPGEYIMVIGGVSMPTNSSAGTEGTTGFDFGIGVADSRRR